MSQANLGLENVDVSCSVVPNSDASDGISHEGSEGSWVGCLVSPVGLVIVCGLVLVFT